MPAITIPQPTAIVAERLVASARPVRWFKHGIDVTELPESNGTRRFRVAYQAHSHLAANGVIFYRRYDEISTVATHVQLIPVDAFTTRVAWAFRPTRWLGFAIAWGAAMVAFFYSAAFSNGRNLSTLFISALVFISLIMSMFIYGMYNRLNGVIRKLETEA